MADTELVTLTIEGTEVAVPKGTMILEAAKRAGIVIPHYCYHPGLPVAGVCRMCLVEVEGLPTLQIGCATQAADGQMVHVYSEQALKARESVLEFLLLNHPLDCPICDQAGECELQNYVFKEGRARTRYTPTYAKRFDPVEDFGPDILHVPNRCILCTRCVRFMEHVADDPVINVSERGDRAFIGIHPDRQLDHPWAGNVVDLCPVGSLISKDFLHKSRAWELDITASICTGCSQGCNISLETRSNTVVRVKPRVNLEVNRHFICDYGRLSYRWMNRGNRIDAPLVRRSGALAAADWDDALERASQIVAGSGGRAVALVSSGASNEALFLTKRLLSQPDFTGAFTVEHVGGDAPLAGIAGLALRSERAPNATGARILGFQERGSGALDIVVGASVVLVLDDTLDGVATEHLDGLENLVYLGTTLPQWARAASVVLPITNVAEEDGTFVNRDYRVQRYLQARSAPGMARPAWWVLGKMNAQVHGDDPLGDASEAFDMMASAETVFAGLSYQHLGYTGATVTERHEVEVTA
ncbi:MAG: (2Fe-2S)-binding protein [Gemmatimonadota bacterium]|nr:MAG: (2Fe-2S)-binding protein [Gemmatimonadota bacterium]